MYSLEAILQQSLKFMDPTGGELMRQVISNISPLMDAVDKDEETTVHQILNDHQKSMGVITSHIKHPQIWEVYIERFGAYCKLVACMKLGKCGYQFLSGCIQPVQTLYRPMSNC